MTRLRWPSQGVLNFTGEARVRVKRLPGIAERDVLAACKKLLAFHPAVIWAARNPVGKGFVIRPEAGVPNPYKVLRAQLDACVAARLLHRNQVAWLEWGEVGASDIVGLLRGGRFLAVETKRRGKKPELEQANFLEMVNGAGGCGLCVDNAMELKEKLDYAIQGS